MLDIKILSPTIFVDKSGQKIECDESSKELKINVPFFANDLLQEIPLRLSISQPKDPGAKPLFTIEIIREERLLADSVAKLIADLRTALPDHMILHGEI